MSTGPVGVEESYNGGATSARPLPRSPEREKTPEIKRYWGGFGAHMSGIPKSFSVEKERTEAKRATDTTTTTTTTTTTRKAAHTTRQHALLAATAK
jgi:hypothetical protein